ncbi:YbaB/EbfC family nucleoid-associated protein [Nocardia goodfellowii]|uniref:DNA-binding protein YbaB n=1 Tax=Nocardia goodfellowii TaxID=882446 RepID=A0ABS4Q775_9NOCA|nr:YbaB/EbfC family nucleoid-associated protein [Nocardia goodfellowii]MBP2187537.1 DNA-binding protein YbaB [Nocardia goodfellowii]
MAGMEGEALRARNEALRGEVDSLLSIFEQQQREFAAAQARLATATVSAWSTDNLIRVTANSAGVPVEVHVDPEAFKRSTPEKLGRSITEATQAAANLAGEEARRAFGSVGQLGVDIPDLPDLVPGAPSIKDLVHQLLPDPAAAPEEPVELDPEAEEEYYRNRSYLEGGK